MNQRGSISLLTVLIMGVLLGFSALAIDIGLIFLDQQKLVDAVDAAALAAIQDIADPVKAENTAIDYAEINGAYNVAVTIDEMNKKVIVDAKKEVPLFFAKIFGISNWEVSAHAVTQAAPIKSGSGFVPLAVEQRDFKYGESYEIKYGGGEGSQGNFGALAFSGYGGNNYKYYLIHGYDGELTVGMEVPTEPGNMSGPTIDGILSRLNADKYRPECQCSENVARDCQRILYLPIVDELDVNGRKGVKIVGFAAFYLEDVYGNGNESTIRGKFIRIIYPGDWQLGGPDFGLFSVKLVE